MNFQSDENPTFSIASGEAADAYARLYAFFKIVNEDVIRADGFATAPRIDAFRSALEGSWSVLSPDDKEKVIRAPAVWELVASDWHTMEETDRAAIRDAGWMVSLTEPIVVRGAR